MCFELYFFLVKSNCITKNVLCKHKWRASLPSTTRLSADMLSFFLHTVVDKHANILVKSLSEYLELVHVSVHKCT